MKQFIIILFLFVANLLHAQNGLLHTINSQQGLPSLTVYSSYYDTKGQVWFCTDKGLCLYNGKSMKIFDIRNGMPDNEVFTVFEDAQGRIWPTNLKGELFYILNNNIITKKNDVSLKKLNTLNVNDKSYTKYVYQLNNDTIYFCSTSLKVNKYSKDGGSCQIDLQDKEFHLMHLYEHQKKIYAVTKKGIIDFYTKKVVTPFIIDKAHEKRFKTFRKRTYFFNNNVIYKLNGTTISVAYEFKELSQITNFSFFDGNNIIVSSSDNCYTYNIIEKSLKPINTLYKKQISNIITDSEKNIWIATLNNGVYLFNNLEYKFYNLNTGVSSLLLYRNNLLIGDVNGNVSSLSTKTKNISLLYDYKEVNFQFSSNHVKKIAVDSNGFLWIGYDKELIKYSLKSEQSNKTVTAVKNIETDAFGHAWAITYYGISLANEADIRARKTSKQFSNDTSLVNYRFYGFCHDSVTQQYYVSYANVFATYNNGILKRDTLPSRILQIKTKNHQLFWILNQDNGLWIYNRQNLKQLSVSNLSGVPTTCNDFYLQNDTTIWVCYNGGYNKLTINKKTRTIKIQQAYELTLNASKTNINKIVYNNGVIYLGTENGLLSIEEKLLTRDSYNVPLLVTDIKINNKPYELKQSYDLDPTQNNITVSFSGLYYQRFGNINYRYKLTNDADWNYTTTNTLEFANLNYGNYVLTINASDKLGNWSKHYVTVSFSIAKPFYLTTTFLLVVIFSALATTFFIAMLYSNKKNKTIRQALKDKTNLLQIKYDLIETQNQLLETEKQKAQAEQKMFMAQVNPHFIFNAINSIQAYVLNSKQIEAYDYLQKFSTLMRNILINSKKITVSIDEDLQNLKLYLEIESLRFNNKLNYAFNITPSKYLQKKIPSMLFQPYVENAIWHGIMPKEEGGNITISANATAHYLTVVITDDGIGREAASRIKSIKKGTGSGLELSESRLKLHSDDLKKTYSITIQDNIKNNFVAGTIIKIEVPLPN